MTSPFYAKNKEFCTKIERFITSKKGRVDGTYNAWSYTILGTISAPKNWTLKYKKATFSSGNILLSTKYQNVLVSAQGETTRTETPSSGFVIRKKRNSDALKRMFNKSLSTFDASGNYILKSDNQTSEWIHELKSTLSPLLKSGEIYEIEYRNKRLKIEMRTENHHFDIFNQLLEL